MVQAIRGRRDPRMMAFKTHDYGTVEVTTAHYTNVRLLIVLRNPAIYPDDRIADLTVNLPDESLADGEFFVKTWSENEAIVEEAMASGLFVDTGRRVPTGYCIAHVWRFAP